MLPRNNKVCGLLMAGLAFVPAGRAEAQLTGWSPFQLRGMAAAVETAKLPLEFCGYIQTAEGWQFRVRDPAGKKAAFVRLNVPEPELGLIARKHDAEGEMLVVEYGGRTLMLPQQTAKVKPAPVAVPLPPQTVPVAAPRAVVPGRVLSPEEVRAEIIRRQEERAKAVETAKAASKR